MVWEVFLFRIPYSYFGITFVFNDELEETEREMREE